MKLYPRVMVVVYIFILSCVTDDCVQTLSTVKSLSEDRSLWLCRERRIGAD
jgi:hypothetical protein